MNCQHECVQSIMPFYTGGPVLVSCDGSCIICKCGCEVKLLNAASGEIVSTNGGHHTVDITALALSISGQELVTAGNDIMVKTWNISTQTKICESVGSPSAHPDSL